VRKIPCVNIFFLSIAKIIPAILPVYKGLSGTFADDAGNIALFVGKLLLIIELCFYQWLVD